jgi:hypothetical protein
VARRNARERRRVQSVNSAFLNLRRSIPIENRNKRVSKVKTLQKAIEYIAALQHLLHSVDEPRSNVNVTSTGPSTRTTHSTPIHQTYVESSALPVATSTTDSLLSDDDLLHSLVHNDMRHHTLPVQQTSYSSSTSRSSSLSSVQSTSTPIAITTQHHPTQCCPTLSPSFTMFDSSLSAASPDQLNNHQIAINQPCHSIQPHYSLHSSGPSGQTYQSTLQQGTPHSEPLLPVSLPHPINSSYHQMTVTNTALQSYSPIYHTVWSTIQCFFVSMWIVLPVQNPTLVSFVNAPALVFAACTNIVSSSHAFPPFASVISACK